MRITREPTNELLERITAERDQMRAALRELVALQELASEHTIKYTPKRFDSAEAQTEYEKRKPKAWAAARAALGLRS